MKLPPVTRWIRGFSKRTDELVLERQISPDWTLKRLQLLVAAPRHDPLFDCWALNPHQLAELDPEFAAQHSHEEFLFFLEADDASV